jgi:ABC-2 type transport system permease protein
MHATMASFSAETLKLRKRPAIKILTTLFITTVILSGYFATYLISESPENADNVALLDRILRTENLVPVVLKILTQFGGPIALILGALAAGSEYGWGTIKTVLTQRPTRTQVLLGQVLALLLLVAVTIVACFATGLGASLIVAQLKGWPVLLPAASELLRGLGAGWLMLSAWMMLGMTLATAFRGTALAIGFGLIYALVIEVLVGAFAANVALLATIEKGLLGINAAALANTFTIDNSPLDSLAIGPLQASLVLGAYIVAGTVISALLQRRDVV